MPDISECDTAATLAERQAGLPPGLLQAIGQVETGRLVPATGKVEPWPWSTNLNGVDHIFATKAEAVAWTEAQLASGYQSIDVGCFQINLKYHPFAFGTIDEAFDPTSNALYAAKFLTELHTRSGGWQIAAAQYHSSDPSLGTPYGQRVFGLLGGAGEFASSVGFHARNLLADADAPFAQASAFGISVILPSWSTAEASTPSHAPSGPGSARLQARRFARPIDLVAWRMAPIRTSGLPRVFTPD